MADDIVTRLRRIAVTQRDCPICGTATAAADEIERLRAEINDLRLRLVALSIPKDTNRG